MKKLLVVLLAVGLGVAANAQPKINPAFRGGSLGGRINSDGGSKGNVENVKPRVTVVTPVVPVYPYYGYAYGYGYSPYYSPFYSPFYDPFYSPRFNQSRPSQLDLQIEDINNEYDFKIKTVKKDKSLSKDERKQQVRDLKHQREYEIIEAKKQYYKDQDEKRNRE